MSTTKLVVGDVTITVEENDIGGFKAQRRGAEQSYLEAWTNATNHNHAIAAALGIDYSLGAFHVEERAREIAQSLKVTAESLGDAHKRLREAQAGTVHADHPLVKQYAQLENIYKELADAIVGADTRGLGHKCGVAHSELLYEAARVRTLAAEKRADNASKMAQLKKPRKRTGMTRDERAVMAEDRASVRSAKRKKTK